MQTLGPYGAAPCLVLRRTGRPISDSVIRCSLLLPALLAPAACLSLQPQSLSHVLSTGSSLQFMGMVRPPQPTKVHSVFQVSTRTIHDP